MNYNELNKNLLENVKSRLPEGTNIANMLMDILYIGKEAVYRRIRGDVPFTLQEAVLIAKKLKVPLDQIVETNPTSSKILMELVAVRYYDMEEIDYDMLEEYIEILEIMVKEPNSEFVYCSNLFPLYPSLKSELLCKFYSFKWMYLNMDTNQIKPLDDITLSQRYFKLNNKIIDLLGQFKNTVYIWDSLSFECIIRETKYFSSIHLFTPENVQAIKEEMYRLIDRFEALAMKGKFDNGNKVDIYVSNINFDTTYSYAESEKFQISMIGVLGLNNVTSTERKTLDVVKNRTQTLKKASTMISESGEMVRINFFNKQRQFVDSL